MHPYKANGMEGFQSQHGNGQQKQVFCCGQRSILKKSAVYLINNLQNMIMITLHKNRVVKGHFYQNINIILSYIGKEYNYLNVFIINFGSIILLVYNEIIKFL